VSTTFQMINSKEVFFDMMAVNGAPNMGAQS
jgi:hypothetical protein